MKLKKYILAGLVMAALSGGSVVAFAYTITNTGAGSNGDFVLEPGKIEVFANPGDTITKNVSVVSRINGDSLFKVSVEDFVGSQDINSPVVLLGNEKSPYSFKDNFKTEVDQFHLTLGQRIILPVTITVPKDALPGGYYSSVIISNQPPSNASTDGGATTQVISRVGVLFFIRVNGPVNESGKIDDFRVEGSKELSLLQKGPLQFQILFNNTGSIYLVPYGDITITNIFGKQVGEVPVDAYFSLPNSLRYRQVTWNQGFLLGRYTAHLSLNKGYNNEVETRDISFWVIPWNYVGGLAVLIIAVALVYYFFLRKLEIKLKK